MFYRWYSKLWCQKFWSPRQLEWMAKNSRFIKSCWGGWLWLWINGMTTSRTLRFPFRVAQRTDIDTVLKGGKQTLEICDSSYTEFVSSVRYSYFLFNIFKQPSNFYHSVLKDVEFMSWELCTYCLKSVIVRNLNIYLNFFSPLYAFFLNTITLRGQGFSV